MGADRSALTAVGVAAVVLVALVATTSGGLGPVHVPHPSSQQAGTPPTHQSSGGSPSNGGSNQQPAPPSGTSHGLTGLPTVSQFVLILVLAGIVLTVIVSLRVAFARRRTLPPARGRPSPLVEEPASEGESLESLESMLGEQLAALDTGSPRNAIVAAWVQLEEYAAGHGLARDPADTPAEFVARALAVYLLDRSVIERFADLYREARFSTHPMEERHRDEARRCLEHLTRSQVAS
ncbi:MAG: DUF4129 domain-containing protein [Marmoricola sp.]